MPEDDFEIDVSDLMEPNTTAPDDSTTSDTEPPTSGEAAPSPTEQAPSEIDQLRAENAKLSEQVNQLLTKVTAPQQAEPQAQTRTAPELPSLTEAISERFDAQTAPHVQAVMELLEKRFEQKMAGYTPRSEWDAAQPVLQRTVLAFDEQRVQSQMKAQGLTDQQVHAAKAAMDKMIQEGQSFSTYDAGYSAGLGRVLLEEKLGKAHQTVAAREEKARRAAVNDNTPHDTPATRPGSIKLDRDTLLNRPFDALEQIAKAGVK